MEVLDKLANAAGNLMKGKSPTAEAARGEVANPANEKATVVTGRRRIPLTTPRLKLETPKIEGFVCQWFADRPGRLQQAQDAAWEFVSPDEIQVNNNSLAGDVARDGNTDLGNRISLHAGVHENGQGMRLYLMKIRQQYWDEDQKELADRSEQVAATIRGAGDVNGNPHEAQGDASLRYVKGAPRRKSAPNIFTRKRA